MWSLMNPTNLLILPTTPPGSSSTTSHGHNFRAEQGRSHAIYIRAHGNAGSLTHWARPGIEPVSSWTLVGFISAEPRQELPQPITFKMDKQGPTA